MDWFSGHIDHAGVDTVGARFNAVQGTVVSFTDHTTFGPFRMNDVDVLDASSEVIGQLYDFAEPELIKAGWNWNLVNNDGSRGVHNPTFASQSLGAAIEALE